MNTCPENISVNGEETDWDYEEANGRITVRLVESVGETTVEVRF